MGTSNIILKGDSFGGPRFGFQLVFCFSVGFPFKFKKRYQLQKSRARQLQTGCCLEEKRACSVQRHGKKWPFHGLGMNRLGTPSNFWFPVNLKRKAYRPLVIAIVLKDSLALVCCWSHHLQGHRPNILRNPDVGPSIPSSGADICKKMGKGALENTPLQECQRGWVFG